MDNNFRSDTEKQLTEEFRKAVEGKILAEAQAGGSILKLKFTPHPPPHTTHKNHVFRCWGERGKCKLETSKSQQRGGRKIQSKLHCTTAEFPAKSYQSLQAHPRNAQGHGCVHAFMRTHIRSRPRTHTRAGIGGAADSEGAQGGGRTIIHEGNKYHDTY